MRTDQAWPSTCRVVRGTLLALAAEMRPDGVVRSLPRDVLAARVGLPVRTLNRHLARAVEMGWLAHRRGQKYVPAEYRAAIPAVSGCHAWPAEKPSQDATRSSAEKPSQDATWWPAHIDRASVSEHVALDKNRERRDDHDGTGAARDREETKSSADVKSQTTAPTPVPVAAAVVAVEPAPYESGGTCRWCEGDISSRTGRCVICRNRPYPGLMVAS